MDCGTRRSMIAFVRGAEALLSTTNEISPTCNLSHPNAAFANRELVRGVRRVVIHGHRRMPVAWPATLFSGFSRLGIVYGMSRGTSRVRRAWSLVFLVDFGPLGVHERNGHRRPERQEQRILWSRFREEDQGFRVVRNRRHSGRATISPLPIQKLQEEGSDRRQNRGADTDAEWRIGRHAAALR